MWEPDVPLDDCREYIAKYYPPTGWYTTREDVQKSLNDFFDKHQHKETWEQSMFGDHFTVMTESLLKSGDDMTAAKREVLGIIQKGLEEGRMGR
jgi:hypothetical protein